MKKKEEKHKHIEKQWKNVNKIKENTVSKNEHEQILNKLKETHKLEISTLQDQIKIKQKLITKNTIKISFLQDSIDKKTKNSTIKKFVIE